MPEAAYRHRVPIRYGEVDKQGVVFNAHYLAYCDDAVDSWLRTMDADFEQHGWDLMLKKAVLEWQGPAGVGEALDIDVGVVRWGNTSFDVGFVGRVGERAVFTGTITYVGVRWGTKEPLAAPPAVRSLLGEARPLA